MNSFHKHSCPPYAFQLLLPILVEHRPIAFVLPVAEGTHIFLAVFKHHDSFSMALVVLHLTYVNVG